MEKDKKTVDQYISCFPLATQERLIAIRKCIADIAPEAVESISYGMPAYKTNKKPLVYFGGYENHIGFYATPIGHAKFKLELSTYKQGKGSVQFPLASPLPLRLISDIIKFRVSENAKAHSI